MHRFKLYLIGSFVLLLQYSSLCHSDTAYLQPASIFLGDITELVLEYDSATPSLYPLDTSALEADFELLDKKSRVMRLSDTDKVIYRMQWRLQLAVRRSGSIVLPEFYFGDTSTPPLRLEVAPVPPALQSSQDVYFEMESASLTSYVGQQTQIEMRLYHNIPVSDVRLYEPPADGALIYRQVEEQVYRITKDGQDYRVRGRGMALFPQIPGELKLGPAGYRGTILSAEYVTSPGARNVFRRSNPLSLRVRVPPAEFSGRFWLPASGLEIAQDWEPADDNLRVGDSLDWTLTIVARGLPAESLPQDLLTTASGDFRIYADKPTRSNRFDGRQMIGRVEQRYAVIASRSGVIELPAVTLKWWDVHNDREQQARLEAKTIQVIAAAGPTQADWSASALLSALTAEGTSSIWLLTVLSLLAGVIVAFRCLGSRCAAWFELLLQRRRREHRLRRCCRANDARGARGFTRLGAGSAGPARRSMGCIRSATESPPGNSGRNWRHWMRPFIRAPRPPGGDSRCGG